MDIVERYEKLYCGVIYDAMKFDLGLDNFVIPKSAGPIVPAWTFHKTIFGPAFTAVGKKTSKPDETVIREIIASLDSESGRVYLLQANDNSRAHFGDITASFMQRAGIKGAVIQGWTRDIDLIQNKGFPIWCKGVQPQDSFDRWHIEDYNCEIVIGNIFISPKDFIFADSDGILVIRKDQVYETLTFAEARKSKEDKIREAINNGTTSTDIYNEIGRW